MSEQGLDRAGTVLRWADEPGPPGVRRAVMTNGERSWELWFRSEQGPLADGIEPLLPAALLAAMKLGGSLTLPGPVSPRLLRSLSTIQDIFHCWWPELSKITIQAAPHSSVSVHDGRGVGAMFTGGVDSFYTLLKHRDDVTHVIYVHGFDVPLENLDLRRRVSTTVRSVAAELGKQVIEVETNFRAMSDPFVSWMSYFGSALASVALLLAPQLRRVYIPSSNTYAQLYPVGAHPLLDPLWSTEWVDIVHDGCEASRMEKVSALSKSDVALRFLRVCWENRDGAYNCGRCEKCLRTMVSLRIARALDRCGTFSRPLDLSMIASLDIPNEHVRAIWEDSLRELQRQGHDPALAHAIQTSLDRRPSRGRRDLLHRLLDRALDALQPASSRRPTP